MKIDAGVPLIIVWDDGIGLMRGGSALPSY